MHKRLNLRLTVCIFRTKPLWKIIRRNTKGGIMLREVLRLTKGDLSNVKRPLHVKKKIETNAGIIKKVQLPLSQRLKHKLKDSQ